MRADASLSLRHVPTLAVLTMALVHALVAAAAPRPLDDLAEWAFRLHCWIFPSSHTTTRRGSPPMRFWAHFLGSMRLTLLTRAQATRGRHRQRLAQSRVKFLAPAVALCLTRAVGPSTPAQTIELARHCLRQAAPPARSGDQATLYLFAGARATYCGMTRHTRGARG
eukprot:3123152-Alexandrium_andersonii.AAC.1